MSNLAFEIHNNFTFGMLSSVQRKVQRNNQKSVMVAVSSIVVEWLQNFEGFLPSKSFNA